MLRAVANDMQDLARYAYLTPNEALPLPSDAEVASRGSLQADSNQLLALEASR